MATKNNKVLEWVSVVANKVALAVVGRPAETVVKQDKEYAPLHLDISTAEQISGSWSKLGCSGRRCIWPLALLLGERLCSNQCWQIHVGSAWQEAARGLLEWAWAEDCKVVLASGMSLLVEPQPE